MKKVALTGNVAAGKTTALNFIKKLGYPVLSSDEVYHQLLKKDAELRNKLSSHFGCSIINGKGINTILLRKILQINPKEIEFVEQVSHPKIIKEIRLFLKKNENKQLVVVDVPLLFEKKLDSMFDFIITVYCSSMVQRKRLKMRHWNDDDMKFIFSNQLPVKTKIKKSDFVIKNDDISLSELKEKIKIIIEKILEK